ncbi:hypothetical protein Q5M85_17560 [Paraclostridium bifermentans]|nr:hypothetical protein [Paraclostridium bifermentans]
MGRWACETLYGLYEKYFALFILGIVLVSFEAICDLMQPTILANIIDIGIANKDMNYLINKGFLMVAITIAGAVFAIFKKYNFNKCISKIC